MVGRLRKEHLEILEIIRDFDKIKLQLSKRPYVKNQNEIKNKEVVVCANDLIEKEKKQYDKFKINPTKRTKIKKEMKDRINFTTYLKQLGEKDKAKQRSLYHTLKVMEKNGLIERKKNPNKIIITNRGLLVFAHNIL